MTLPDLNPLAGPWTEAYAWPELSQGVAPNAGQPDAHHARVRITSVGHPSQIPGPGSELRYVFNVSNLDPYPLDRATLIVSGSDGLRFESLSGWPLPGASSAPGPQDDRWFVDLGTLAPRASHFLTITARVKEDIAGTHAVTVTAAIEAGLAPGEPDLSTDTLSHAVDGRPPTVRFNLPDTGATLPSGPQTVTGSAFDPLGGGVASVQVRIHDGPWLPASGTRTWSTQIDVPATGQFTLDARAFDIYGYAARYDVPLLPVYQCVGLMHRDDPSRIRVAWWLPAGHTADGQVAWLRRYYPSLYRQLCAWMPDARMHA